jgi:hypothetical protein
VGLALQDEELDVPVEPSGAAASSVVGGVNNAVLGNIVGSHG